MNALETSYGHREKGPVNLYLDQETRDVFTKEASRVGLTFSAYLRVLRRIFQTPVDSELRERVRAIITEESRRV